MRIAFVFVFAFSLTHTICLHNSSLLHTHTHTIVPYILSFCSLTHHQYLTPNHKSRTKTNTKMKVECDCACMCACVCLFSSTTVYEYTRKKKIKEMRIKRIWFLCSFSFIIIRCFCLAFHLRFITLIGKPIVRALVLC